MRKLLSAMLLATVATTSMAQAPTRATRPGVYAAVERPTYEGYVRSSFFVPARDGVRLAVTLYRPANAGKAVQARLPVLFSFTPYLARRIDENGAVVGTIEQKTPRGRPFADLAKYGYVVAVADVRGKGSSFGVRSGYADLHEGEDGADLVEWLAAQAWSDGKVGMFGCSYVGGTQWATARNVPPHLRAIFPQAAQFDSYRNVRRGGISGQFNTRPQSVAEDNPTAPVDVDTDGTLKRAALKQHEANGQMSDLVAALAFRDDRTAEDVDYWALSSPYPKIAAIRAAGISVYAWGNWMDEPADQAMLTYENTKGGTGLAKLIMGPGGHCDTDSLDSFAEHLRYFDHVLKGMDNGIDREPAVWFKTIGLPEAEAWRFAPGLPLTHDAPTRLFFAEGGALAQARPRARPDRYAVTYQVGCKPPAWSMPRPGPSDPPPSTDPDVLPPPGLWACVNPTVAKGYTTAVMKEPMWLSGFSTVHLRLASSAPEAYVFAYLEDVAPDGAATLIAHGRLLASQRAVARAPYRNFDLPFHSAMREDARPLIPGQVVDLDFELSPTSRIIAAGHRLRLSFTGADQRQRNIADLKITPTPTWTIATGGRDGSFLDLTLAPATRLTAAEEILHD